MINTGSACFYLSDPPMIYADDYSADSGHVVVVPARFVAGPEVGKQTKTPIVYRLRSRPIAGTMEIIERTNYDSAGEIQGEIVGVDAVGHRQLGLMTARDKKRAAPVFVERGGFPLTETSAGTLTESGWHSPIGEDFTRTLRFNRSS